MAVKSPMPHAVLSSLKYVDNVLMWGGRKVTDIAAETGSTPLFVYDSQLMSQRVSALRSALPEMLQIHYAIKANPMPEVVAHMASLVDGLDVASEGELQVALKSGANSQTISFAGPGKRNFELEAAIQAGVTINIESGNELRRVIACADRLKVNANVAVRVNPSFELKTAGMKMGGRPSQFGIDAELVPAILEEIDSAGLNYRGLHVFSGSQNLSPAAVAETLEQTVELVLSISDATSMGCPTVNLGGGLGIPYFPGEKHLDLSLLTNPYGKAVERLSQELDYPKLVIELGRYLVGESGIYVCKVVDIKDSQGVRFAICDGGLHHHLAVTGNFGQILRKNYPVVSVEKNSKQMETITVVGPLCTPLDILADKMRIGRLREGSLIAILQSGAYGVSASPNRFLSHPPCMEVLI